MVWKIVDTRFFDYTNDENPDAVFSEKKLLTLAVSCMPGFIASIFDVICKEAKKHTEIPDDQIVRMVLSTLSSTGDLMLQKDMTFEEVVERVATKGGITQEGTAVVYEKLPDVADELFEKTLAKRRMVAEKAKEAYGLSDQ